MSKNIGTTKNPKDIKMKIESLGRMAVFCIPAWKWSHPYKIDEKMHVIGDYVGAFLSENYNGYIVRGPFMGRWNSVSEDVIEVKASFLGKDRIPKLHKFLAKLCTIMGEECIYLETGEDAFLVYP